jgi:hypothetical protein
MFKENSPNDNNFSTTSLEDLFNPETIKNIKENGFSSSNNNTIDLLDDTNNKIINSNHFDDQTNKIKKINKIKQLEQTTKSSINEVKKKYYKNKKAKTILALPKKKIGRKRKNDTSIAEHDKYAVDNLRRKCKRIILSYALNFINETIKKIYNNNIGNGIYRKQLLPLKNYQQYDTTIDFNQNLLNKTLYDIFSEEVSSKYTCYLPNHNQIIINTLLNEKDEYKRLFFKNLLDVTFLQCLNKFIGKEDIKELIGFKTFYEYKETSKDEPQYIDALKYNFITFEETIKGSRQRHSGTKQGKEEIIYNEKLD